METPSLLLFCFPRCIFVGVYFVSLTYDGSYFPFPAIRPCAHSRARKMIDTLLAKNMHEVLLENDQLGIQMKENKVLTHFTEPPLFFRPTYKFDVGGDVYDTGKKQRLPAWCDRILYVDRKEDRVLQCFEYDSDFSITTSDHKPVQASFVMNLLVPADESAAADGAAGGAGAATAAGASVGARTADTGAAGSGSSGFTGTAMASGSGGGAAPPGASNSYAGAVVPYNPSASSVAHGAESAQPKVVLGFTSESQVCSMM